MFRNFGSFGPSLWLHTYNPDVHGAAFIPMFLLLE
jgi:hypothetical protein